MSSLKNAKGKIANTARPENTQKRKLKFGWTTGTCATAATKAALQAILTGEMPIMVEVTTPSGKIANLAVNEGALINDESAKATIIKDAGDDPDVTHGAKIGAYIVRRHKDGQAIRFFAGEGVGIVTKAGLPLAIGEPAINTVPRKMIQDIIKEMVSYHQGEHLDYDVTIFVENGEALAQKTWNPRLGIEGGLSILGTSGVVRPYSCAAWIASIHRGIDVGRANGLQHMIASTGNQSEKAAREIYDLPDIAMIDMGDFIGGMLKYLRKHPIPNLTIAGGVAKMTKFAQNAMDLHSARSQLNFPSLQKHYQEVANIPPQTFQDLNTMMEFIDRLSDDQKQRLFPLIAKDCQAQAQHIMKRNDIKVNIMLCDRRGHVIHETGFEHG